MMFLETIVDQIARQVIDDFIAEAGKKTPKAPYGSQTPYADPGLQKDKKKRYPVDTEEHIRAAWSYINKPKNAAAYGNKVGRVKAKIVAAWKKKIDKAGPPSAKK